MATSYVIPPFSVSCLNGSRIFPNYYVGVGPGALRYRGIGVASSGNLSGGATGELIFQIPRGLPSGSPYLNGYVQVPVNTGSGNFEILWSTASSGQNPAAFNLLSEGTNTITYSANESGVLKPITIPLDATGISAGNVVMMRTVFNSGSLDFQQTSTWRFWIEYQ